MSVVYTIRCSHCGYQAQSICGKENGTYAVIETYRCKSCRELVDVLTGEYGRIYNKSKIHEIIPDRSKAAEFYLCPGCGSGENLVKWNKYRKQCPRCGERMETVNE